MKKVRAISFRLLSILMVFGLLSAPAAALGSSPAQQSSPGRAAQFQEVPDEIRSFFEGGVSVDRFLALNAGKVPHALEQFATQEVTVVIQMQAEPLAAFYAQQRQTRGPVSPGVQQAYQADLANAQTVVANGIRSLGGRVISQYTKAYNGLLVRVPAGQLQALQRLPGVAAIRQAPVHVPALSNSVPHIRADEVIEDLGYDGEGTTIAIIDTGVDYTHATFGGPGTPEAYEENDRTVIEPGTFPTEKVIGGFDFAGADYDADSDDPALNTPNPDPDPLDGDGHGTHVASTAAGEGVEGKLGHGVAPGAKIYALKVFGEPAGSTNLAVNAIEWALDPNQDNDLSDHVDVINMSLGSAFGIADLLEPGIVAVEYATRLGVVVVASAGNNGDVSYITGAPAAADSAISVAASTTGFLTGPTITLPETVESPRSQIIYNPGGFDDNTGHFETGVTAPVTYVGNLFDDDLLCTIPDEAAGTTPLDGQIALIQRGVCGFSDKANNAAELGAVAAIIFNHAAGGNTLVNMVGPPVAIPVGFVAHDDGLILVSAHGETVDISAENDVVIVPDPYLSADTVADFSSRGPRSLDAFQKPDVTAPGASIFAAKMGSGDEGVSFSGTSMSAPHVAGVAALIRQAHPDWSPEQVKAAIMNTATDLLIGSAEVPRQGAGRVDAFRAVTTDAFAIGERDRISLSWGVTEFTTNFYRDTKSILLHDLSGEDQDYSVSVVWGENSFESGVSLTISDTVSVSAGRPFAYLPVELNIDGSQIPVAFNQLEEYYGYVVFTGEGESPDTLRVPFYLIPQPYSRLTFTDIEFRPRSAMFEITNQGPISSSLSVFPLYEIDEDELEQDNMADLRMVGMDFGFTHPTFGDIFIPAINVHGSWFTPQPYFAEFDLYLDVDRDGSPDFVNFNWNAGAAFGTGDDDVWIVVQVDLRTFTLDLGSPFLIFTDYNSGYMEWGLPAEWHELSVTGNSDFDWLLAAFDATGNQDATSLHTFDLAHPPIEWELSNDPGPDNRRATLTVRIRDLEGVLISNPLGVMLVDYNGQPGVGQAYPITPAESEAIGVLFRGGGSSLFLPLVSE